MCNTDINNNEFLKKIAGVVVWYNPKDEDIKNLFTYIEYIDKLYIYDNSQNNNYEKIIVFEKYKSKIEYIHLGQNNGIAAALNYCANLSIINGYSWLLTMDQDSLFRGDTFKNFYKYLNEDKLGIVGPNYVHKTEKEALLQKNIYLDKILTSGNLINLKIHKELNGFDEKLFIDEVDHEYCYRVNKKYKIKQVADVYLEHSLGDVSTKKFLFLTFVFTEHSSFRRYYMIRNGLYVMSKYPEIRKEYSVMLLKSIIKIILFESNKKEKMKSVFRGIKDFRKM